MISVNILPFYTARPLLPSLAVCKLHSHVGFIVKDRWPGVTEDTNVGCGPPGRISLWGLETSLLHRPLLCASVTWVGYYVHQCSQHVPWGCCHSPWSLGFWWWEEARELALHLLWRVAESLNLWAVAWPLRNGHAWILETTVCCVVLKSALFWELMSPVRFRFLSGSSSRKERNKNRYWREIGALKLCLSCCSFGVQHWSQTQRYIHLNPDSGQPALGAQN